MEAISPVCPGYEGIEIVLGKGQPQYNILPVVVIDTDSRPMVSRWRLSDEEREAIAQGADIVLTQLTFGLSFRPVNLQIVGQEEMPQLIEG